MRPQIDLETHKEYIIHLFQSGVGVEAIRSTLQTRGIATTTRTIERRLHGWGVRKRTTIDDAIRNNVWELLCKHASTRDILEVLDQEGTPISTRTLTKIRQDLGVQLRVDDPIQQQQKKKELEAILAADLGDSEGYGRQVLQTHLRSYGHFYAR
jgi:hypothetical protein